MADFAYGFLFSPAIELLGATVPKVYSTVDGASYDASVYAFKKIVTLLSVQFWLLD
jgi:hypothetical protein